MQFSNSKLKPGNVDPKGDRPTTLIYLHSFGHLKLSKNKIKAKNVNLKSTRMAEKVYVALYPVVCPLLWPTFEEL